MASRQRGRSPAAPLYHHHVRVVYYTHPAFLEPALSLVRELADQVELHLLLEVAPSAWRSAAFDLAPLRLAPGLVPADPVLAPAFPAEARAYWRHAATFNLVVHGSRGSFRPGSLAVGRDVLRYIRRVGPDIVHVDDTDVSPRLALVAPGLGRPPLVLNIHDPVPHPGEHGWRKDLARRLLYPRASRFVVFADRFRKPFANRVGIPLERVRAIRLAPYDILRAWAQVPEAQEDRLILLVGRLAPYKGLDILAAAARLAAERVPGLRVVAAGRPVRGYRPPPAASLSRGGRIEFRDGYLSNEELVRLIRRASVVVCPYLDATQSGVVLTAFGLGRTVIATTAGGLSEYVLPGVNGALVAPGDVAGLSNAIVALLLDPAERRRLEAGVRERPGQANWAGAARQLLDVYAQLAPSSALRGSDRA